MIPKQKQPKASCAHHPDKFCPKLLFVLALAGSACTLAAGFRYFLPPIRLQDRKRYPFALVLGCGSHADGTTSRSQRGRCLLAEEQYDQGRFDTLIISGAAVSTPYVEADVMKDWLLKHRKEENKDPIPVVCERQARNTWENFSRTKEMTGDVPLMILTGSTHARRASAMAANFFSEYCVVSYPDFTLKKFLREIISRWQYCSLELSKKFGPKR